MGKTCSLSLILALRVPSDAPHHMEGRVLRIWVLAVSAVMHGLISEVMYTVRLSQAALAALHLIKNIMSMSSVKQCVVSKLI